MQPCGVSCDKLFRLQFFEVVNHIYDCLVPTSAYILVVTSNSWNQKVDLIDTGIRIVCNLYYHILSAFPSICCNDIFVIDTQTFTFQLCECSDCICQRKSKPSYILLLFLLRR